MRRHALRLAALAALVTLAFAAGDVASDKTAAAAPPPPLLVPLTPAQARSAAADGPGQPGAVIAALEAAPGTAALALASLSTAALAAPALTLPLGAAIPPPPASWATGAGGQEAAALAAAPPPSALLITRTSLEAGPVPGSLTWKGKVDGAEAGPAAEAILTVVDGAVAGTVRQGGRLWQVRTIVPGTGATAAASTQQPPAKEGPPGSSGPPAPAGEAPKPAFNAAAGAVVALVAVDEAAFPPDDAEEVTGAPAGHGGDAPATAATATPAAGADGPVPAAAGNPLIRVQFLYTPATRDALGGDAAARALAAHSIDLANEGLANSAIPATAARFQWTGGAAVVPEASEGDGWFTLRNRLANPADGWADWATVRDRAAAQADVTVMLVNLMDLCGLAVGIGRAQASPAPVVLVSHVCVAKHSVLHEIGHLAGLRHDADHDSTSWPDADAHGLRLFAGRPPYRTVMGYPCTGSGQPDCPRLNVFSNPAVTVNGVPSGIEGQANNARVFKAAGGWMARLFENGGKKAGVVKEGVKEGGVASADAQP